MNSRETNANASQLPRVTGQPEIYDQDGVLRWQSRWNNSQGVWAMLLDAGSECTLTSILGSVRYRCADAKFVAEALRRAAQVVEDSAP